MVRQGSLSTLRHKPFRLFLLARLVSMSGTAMAPVALAFAVLGFDSRPASLAIVLAANTAPQLVLLLVGGVIADRFSRQRVMVLGNLVPAVTQGCVALLVVSGAATTGRIALFAALAGCASALTQPAMNSVLPQLVDPGELQQANALMRLPSNLIRILAPAVGGALVVLVGPELTLGWDAASFAVAALLCSRLGVSGPAKTPASVFRDFKDGWKEFSRLFWIWSYVLSGTVVVALWLGGYQLLGPVVAMDSRLGAPSWGIVQGAFAAGLFLGGIVSLTWKPSRIMVVCVCANVPLALPLVALAEGAPLAVLAGAAALAGIGLDIAIVCWSTAVQEHLPPEVLGRVSSFSSAGELMSVPLGYLVVGAAATSLGTESVLLWSAVLMTAASLVLLLAPSVWAVRRLPDGPGPAAAAGDQDHRDGRSRTGRAPDQVARP
ncbi:MFS transporter [Streptomyces avidinii]|uniref:MFS transporter n=1 Tax=Streptomyces avidinii TaxID=1895 RepID=UPI00386DD18B|nr:MFS transporter [Streptomyces avidinii]